MSYPIIDLVRVFVLRIINGKSPFVADKNHIHHLINKKIKSHLYTTITISSATLILMLFIQLAFLFYKSKYLKNKLIILHAFLPNGEVK